MNIEKIAEIIERKFGCYTETANLVERQMIESLRYIHKMEAAAAMIERLLHERDAASTRLAEAREVDADLAAFSKNTGWELSHKCPHFADDDDDEICWIVTEVRGGRNDRKWHVIGKGNTPAEAIRAARAWKEANNG